MTRKFLLLLLCLVLALPLGTTGMATAQESGEEEGNFTASTPDGQIFESAMPGIFGATGGSVSMNGRAGGEEGDRYFVADVVFEGTYSYETGEVSGNAGGSYLSGVGGKGWSRFEGDEGEWSGTIDPITGKGSGSYEITLTREVHPGPNFGPEVAEPYSGFLQGNWETTFQLYPWRWLNVLAGHKKEIMKVYLYMKEQAKKVETTCPNESVAIDGWADKLLNTRLYDGGQKIDKHASASTMFQWMNLYDNFLTDLNALSFTTDSAELQARTARAASIFIHEMRHLNGRREFGAYSYEWGLFECLGVAKGSRRYNNVQGALSGDIVQADYDAQTDTWSRGFRYWVPFY
jgi:hypothetical protein